MRNWAQICAIRRSQMCNPDVRARARSKRAIEAIRRNKTQYDATRRNKTQQDALVAVHLASFRCPARCNKRQYAVLGIAADPSAAVVAACCGLLRSIPDRNKRL